MHPNRQHDTNYPTLRTRDNGERNGLVSSDLIVTTCSAQARITKLVLNSRDDFETILFVHICRLNDHPSCLHSGDRKGEGHSSKQIASNQHEAKIKLLKQFERKISCFGKNLNII